MIAQREVQNMHLVRLAAFEVEDLIEILKSRRRAFDATAERRVLCGWGIDWLRAHLEDKRKIEPVDMLCRRDAWDALAKASIQDGAFELGKKILDQIAETD